MSKLLRRKNMTEIRAIQLPEDGGTVTLYQNSEEYIIHRYAARGKVENWVSNYELINEDNESPCIPLRYRIW
jgi:hypothetical protein